MFLIMAAEESQFGHSQMLNTKKKMSTPELKKQMKRYKAQDKSKKIFPTTFLYSPQNT